MPGDLRGGSTTCDGAIDLSISDCAGVTHGRQPGRLLRSFQPVPRNERESVSVLLVYGIWVLQAWER